ncbi:XRE family transcriptional regulator, partial [Dysosmobacter welbionis]
LKSLSGRFIMVAFIVFMPNFFAAARRRFPSMTSYLPSAVRLTLMGTFIPFLRMSSTNSLKDGAFSSILKRLFAMISSTGTCDT